MTWIFSIDVARIDRRRVHRWLSEESYWARGRSWEQQDMAIEASRNYGVYDGQGRQVAYGRLVTDGATFGWLCDVFVDAAVRGQGVGKLLTAGILEDLEPLGLPRILLKTADAHGLYALNGFRVVDDPERYMVWLR